MAMLIVPLIANAICVKNEPNWLWNYEGSIGSKYRVRMTLIFSGRNVNGVYFYANELKDIQLQGRIINGVDIILDELNAAGKAVARFEGKFLEHDDIHRRFGSNKLECEIIVGSWHKLNSNKIQSVDLSIDSGTFGTLTNRYSIAGAQDDSLIHQNALLFWNAVKRKDKRTVASLILYPIAVGISNGTKLINSPNELITNYNAIFSPRYRKAIVNALPRNMFVRDQGVMLGNGEVWFNSNGKIIGSLGYPVK